MHVDVYVCVFVCMCVCVCFVGLATINSFYARETLKDSKKIDIRPEMLEVCVYVCMLLQEWYSMWHM